MCLGLSPHWRLHVEEALSKSGGDSDDETERDDERERSEKKCAATVVDPKNKIVLVDEVMVPRAELVLIVVDLLEGDDWRRGTRSNIPQRVTLRLIQTMRQTSGHFCEENRPRTQGTSSLFNVGVKLLCRTLPDVPWRALKNRTGRLTKIQRKERGAPVHVLQNLFLLAGKIKNVNCFSFTFPSSQKPKTN
jgi:hypothetical protein